MTIPLSSAKDDLCFSYVVAQGYLRLMSRFTPKGGRAIYLSRFKTQVINGIEEIEKQRLIIVKEHAELVPLPEPDPQAVAAGDCQEDVPLEKRELKVGEDNQAVFPNTVAEGNCKKAITELFEEVPVRIDITSPVLTKSAEIVYQVLMGEDCPPTQAYEKDAAGNVHTVTDDWFHARIIEEMEAAMPGLPETLAKMNEVLPKPAKAKA
jgi:hypothetical protein